MGSGQPVPQREMLGLAAEVAGLLTPFCTRIAIAGSIRRGKDMVSDIEIVCQPDFQVLPSMGKFLEVKQNALEWQIEQLCLEHIFEQRMNGNNKPESWGDRHKRAFYKGVNLDLFIVQPDRSWGRQMLIATGPADANAVLVTRLGVRNKKGHLGVLPKPLEFRDGEIYSGPFHLPTPEEVDVFEAIGLPYVAPHLRTVETYQILSRRARDYWPRPLPAWVSEYGFPGQSWIGSPPGDDVWVGGRRHLMTVVRKDESVSPVHELEMA